MIKSYLLVALRNLKKQKMFSLINLLGMAVGMACFTLFAQVAGVKLNADRFHKNADEIYTVVQVRTNENQEEVHTTFVPAPLALALHNDFPEIQEAARVLPAGRLTVKHQDNSFYENNVLFVDPSFLSVFSFKMEEGSPETALSGPNSIVISEAKATKYFGDEESIGKVLTLENNINVTVTGVTKNIPRTSSLRFDFLVSMETARALSFELDDWKTNQHTTFLLVGAEFNHKRFEQKLPAFMDKHFADSKESPQQLYLFPFRDFRLKSRNISSIIAQSHPVVVVITFAVGILLLFVVCINFINLSTARSMYRAKEIGMRKVIGARRSQLILQFLGESLLLSFLALPAAVILYELLHPVLASYIGNFSALGYTSNVSNSIFNYPFLLKYLVVAAVLSGFFSGIYPAIFLSSFPPLRVIKGNLSLGRQKKRGSKVLIAFQFGFAVIFIAAASLIKHQFGQMVKADFGYNRQQVAVVRLGKEALPQLELLKTKFASHANVVHVSAAGSLPVVWENPVQAWPIGVPEEAFTLQAYGVDYGFTESLEMKIVDGRSFSRAQSVKGSFILSETAVKKLQWEDPVGKQLTVGEQTGTVVGVVEDFLFADIGFNLPPAVLYHEPENLNFMLIKYSSPEGFPDLKGFMKQEWLSVNPNLPFECQTLDDYFNSFFQLLSRLAGFLNAIGLAAVLFSSLGLFGLASYMIEQRTKEIGIRKVLGASSVRILWKLMREYLILVAIANVVSLGLIYFGWNKVLQTGLLFITNIGVATYAYALTVTFFTAVAAVGFKTLKTARANPAESLRCE